MTTTERRTSVIFENDEVDGRVSAGSVWIRLKLMRNMASIIPSSALPGAGEFTDFAEFEEFVEALLQIRAMVRTELAGVPKRQ